MRNVIIVSALALTFQLATVNLPLDLPMSIAEPVNPSA